MKYKVLVDDNFHFMDEDERTVYADFDTLERAVAACQRIVNDFLVAHYRPGMSAEALYKSYTDFGDDPFMVPKDEHPFSAWDYARMRCGEICGASSQR